MLCARICRCLLYTSFSYITSQSIKSKGWLPNLFRGIVTKAKDFLQNLIREKDMPPKPTLDIDMAEFRHISMTGPLILLSYFIGWWCILPCAAFFAIIIWASLSLKRHTPKELVFGSLTAAVSFLLGILLTGLL